MEVLLVEPKSSTSYPPLGLMKIATYHNLQGHNVRYVLGNNKEFCAKFWDKIYITTTFTYDIKHAVDTIRFYSGNLFNFRNIQVGGISATLMPEYIKEKTGITPHVGLLNSKDDFLVSLSKTDKRFEYLTTCGHCIDALPPAYDIFPVDTKYSKILSSSYLLYSTKGCPNKCSFCAVKTLEPTFVPYIPIRPRVEYIRDNFGPKNGLIFLDNNIVHSNKFPEIIEEIRSLGFGKDSKFEYKSNGRTIKKQCFVDYNQGVDARKITESSMKLMASIAIKPLRLAFDSIKDKDIYTEKMRLAIRCGVYDLSNYMLYNHEDQPRDLYERMYINTRLKEEFSNIRIFSFPMRYSPVTKRDRKHVGKYWIERQIKAVQSILNATHGIVSHNPTFFYRAFGNTADEFIQISLMPYHYILNRDFFENHYQGIDLWKAIYNKMSAIEKNEFFQCLSDKELEINHSDIVYDLLTLYNDESRIVYPKSEWGNMKNKLTAQNSWLHEKYTLAGVSVR